MASWADVIANAMARLPTKCLSLVLRMPAQAFQIFDVGKPMHKDPGDHVARLAQALNATALAFS